MARTFRATRSPRTCRNHKCSYCGANRTFSTRKRQMAAAEALREASEPDVPVGDASGWMGEDGWSEADEARYQETERRIWAARYDADWEYASDWRAFERERATAWD